MQRYENKVRRRRKKYKMDVLTSGGEVYILYNNKVCAHRGDECQKIKEEATILNIYKL